MCGSHRRLNASKPSTQVSQAMQSVGARATCAIAVLALIAAALAFAGRSDALRRMDDALRRMDDMLLRVEGLEEQLQVLQSSQNPSAPSAPGQTGQIQVGTAPGPVLSERRLRSQEQKNTWQWFVEHTRCLDFATGDAIGSDGDFSRVAYKVVNLVDDQEELIKSLKMQGLSLFAVLAAAFGEATFFNGDCVLKGVEMYNRALMEHYLPERVELLRKMLSRSPPPILQNASLVPVIGEAFKKIANQEIQIPHDILHVMAWGTLKALLHMFDGNCAPPRGDVKAYMNEISTSSLKADLAPELSSTDWWPVLHYIAENPTVLNERNEEGLTLLMEANIGKGCSSSVPGAWTGAWNVMTGLHEHFRIPMSAMTDGGMTAAMLGVRAEHLYRAQMTELAGSYLESQISFPLFHFENVEMIVLGLHAAVIVVSFLFSLARSNQDTAAPSKIPTPQHLNTPKP